MHWTNGQRKKKTGLLYPLCIKLAHSSMKADRHHDACVIYSCDGVICVGNPSTTTLQRPMLLTITQYHNNTITQGTRALLPHPALHHWPVLPRLKTFQSHQHSQHTLPAWASIQEEEEEREEEEKRSRPALWAVTAHGVGYYCPFPLSAQHFAGPAPVASDWSMAVEASWRTHTHTHIWHALGTNEPQSTLAAKLTLDQRWQKIDNNKNPCLLGHPSTCR